MDQKIKCGGGGLLGCVCFIEKSPKPVAKETIGISWTVCSPSHRKEGEREGANAKSFHIWLAQHWCVCGAAWLGPTFKKPLQQDLVEAQKIADMDIAGGSDWS